MLLDTRRFRLVKYVLLLISILAISTACGGKSAGEAPVTAGVPAEISDEVLANALFQSLQDGDAAGLDQLLAPEFIIQRSDGKHLTKAEYLANPPTVHDFEITDVVGRHGADNVRAIRYTVRSSEIIDGRTITKDPVPRLSVFVWNGERWQLFAHSNFAALN